MAITRDIMFEGRRKRGNLLVSVEFLEPFRTQEHHGFQASGLAGGALLK